MNFVPITLAQAHIVHHLNKYPVHINYCQNQIAPAFTLPLRPWAFAIIPDNDVLKLPRRDLANMIFIFRSKAHHIPSSLITYLAPGLYVYVE